MITRYSQGDVRVYLRKEELEVAFMMANFIHEAVHFLQKDPNTRKDHEVTERGFATHVAKKLDETLKAKLGYALRSRSINLLVDYLEKIARCEINLPGNILKDEIVPAAPPGEYAGALRLYDEYDFSEEATAYLLHVLVCEFDLPPISFSYAITAQRPMDDAYGGGAAFISRQRIRFQDTTAFIMECEEEECCDLPAAAREGDLDQLETLLKKGADPDAEDGLALRWAARNGKANTFGRLLEAGARFDLPGLDDLVAGKPDIESMLQAARLAASMEDRAPRSRIARKST